MKLALRVIRKNCASVNVLVSICGAGPASAGLVVVAVRVVGIVVVVAVSVGVEDCQRISDCGG